MKATGTANGCVGIMTGGCGHDLDAGRPYMGDVVDAVEGLLPMDRNERNESPRLCLPAGSTPRSVRVGLPLDIEADGPAVTSLPNKVSSRRRGRPRFLCGTSLQVSWTLC